MSNSLIMVVDDNQVVRNTIHRMLQTIGYDNVCLAENGSDALGMARECRPDVILMDIEMPEMDGISASHEITTSCPGLKVVMMTGAGTPTRVTDSFRAGASNFLLKPFKSNALGAVIRKALNVQPGYTPGASVYQS